MSPIRRLLPTGAAALLAAAACGGQPVGAQTPAPRDDGLAHPYLYEVASTQVADAQTPPTIEVSGQGEATATPDLARAAFAMETHAKTAGEAAAANATAMDAVIRALRAAGIEGMKVESFGYSLQPQYSFTTRDGVQSREISGYVAQNNVRATVPDVSAIGRAIDAAIRAGANRVSSLTFEASDTEHARREALTLAVRAARTEAEAIAAALGRELGPVLEVHGGTQVPGPRPRTEMLMRAAQADTPVEAADQTITASVTIRFAIGSPRG